MAGNLSMTREYDRIWTIVTDKIQPVLHDIVTTKTAMLYHMRDMGAIEEVGGQPHLSFGILKELPASIGYTDGDTLTPVRPDPWSRCYYNWKQIAVPVMVSGLDMIRTGDGAEIDLLEGMIQAAEAAMKEAIGGSTKGIFSSADEDNPRAITGFQNFFTTSTTTGTVGGLNRATLAKWRHKYQNVASAFDTNGFDMIRTMFRQASKFDFAPNTLVGTGSFMDNFEKELAGVQAVNLDVLGFGPGKSAMLDAGFPNLTYKGMAVFNDDACDDIANVAYMCNVGKFIKLYVRSGRNAELGDFVKPVDKDELAFSVYWAGNLCNTNLSVGGLLANVDTY